MMHLLLLTAALLSPAGGDDLDRIRIRIQAELFLRSKMEQPKKIIPKTETKPKVRTFVDACKEAADANLPLVVGIDLDVPKGDWVAYRAPLPWVVYQEGGEDAGEWTYHDRGYVIHVPEGGVIYRIKRFQHRGTVEQINESLAAWRQKQKTK